MRRVLAGILAFILLCPAWLLGADVTTQKPKRAVKAPTVSEELQQLKTQLDQQQSQIKQQQELINQLQQQVQQNNTSVQQQNRQLESALEQAAKKAAAAEQSAQAARADAAASAPKIQAIEQTVVQTQKNMEKLEKPAGITYKGITITPGGYLAATLILRGRNMNNDVGSAIGGVPFDKTANANLSEYRFSARSSRVALTFDGLAGKTRLRGYAEVDFMGQGLGANQVQSNSYGPRQRQLYVQADFPSGLTITAGQMWSLITTNRKGIANRAEFIPNVLDPAYVAGWQYNRQVGFRVTKNIQNKVWTAFELSNSETTLATSYTPANLFGFSNSATANVALAGTSTSTNLAPDVMAKVAFEPGYGHYEIKALGRFFRDRFNGTNDVSYGGGLGAAAILPLVDKKVDFAIQGMAGAGIGRYGATGTADVTIRPDGKIVPIRGLQAMAGLEFHPTPQLDLLVFAGDEIYKAAAYQTSDGKPAGYGSHLVNTTNCMVEIVPSGGAACGAQNKNIFHITGGMWYRLLRGSYGTLAYGLQYQYVNRTAFSGIGGTPKGSNNIIFSEFRYALP